MNLTDPNSCHLPRLLAGIALLGVALVAALALGTAGASEIVSHATSTTLVCEPAEGAVGTSRTCKATVTDTSSGPYAPTGQVVFAGNFRCALVATGPASAECGAQTIPQTAGSYTAEATYFGDVGHTSSIGKATLVAGAASASPMPITSWSAVGAPGSKLLKGPPKKTHSRVAKFTFSAEPSSARFECRVDKGLFEACSSPYTVKAAPGRHVFRLRAISSTGAYDEDPEEYRWTVLPPHRKGGR